MKKLLLLASASLLMAACSDSATAPASPKKSATDRSAADDLTCRSGYVVAFDENGNPYCAPVDGGMSSPMTTSPTTTSPTTPSQPGKPKV